MEQIRQNRIRLDALVQWVKVVYQAELECYDANTIGRDTAQENQTNSLNEEQLIEMFQQKRPSAGMNKESTIRYMRESQNEFAYS